MTALTHIRVLAGKEILDRMRNRWILAATLLLAALAVGLALLGTAPVGSVGAGRMEAMLVSLASLSMFLVPLLGLMLAHDAIAGEAEQGLLMLVLATPATPWRILLGKLLGHGVVLALALGVGFGGAAGAVAFSAEGPAPWGGLGLLTGASWGLGVVFAAVGLCLSTLSRDRATAVALALGVWLVSVLLFDAVLLGLLVNQPEWITPQLLPWLMLANPPDAFRMLTLGGLEGLDQFAGLSGISGSLALSPGVIVAALAGWAALPLALAGVVFSRRES